MTEFLSHSLESQFSSFFFREFKERQKVPLTSLLSSPSSPTSAAKQSYFQFSCLLPFPLRLPLCISSSCVLALSCEYLPACMLIVSMVQLFSFDGHGSSLHVSTGQAGKKKRERERESRQLQSFCQASINQSAVCLLLT
mmetsp:Transcript_29233/g.57385  ORF Transcript_29233/g.57385 Transcript_29233/m.57385 type:complete len:139 (+) Transcript_29233:3264-3680(+)